MSGHAPTVNVVQAPRPDESHARRVWDDIYIGAILAACPMLHANYATDRLESQCEQRLEPQKGGSMTLVHDASHNITAEILEAIDFARRVADLAMAQRANTWGETHTSTDEET